jgi:hypothetical protein
MQGENYFMGQIYHLIFHESNNIKTDKTESLRPRILQSFCQIGARKALWNAAAWLGAPRQDLPPCFVRKRQPDSMVTSCSADLFLRDGRDKI